MPTTFAQYLLNKLLPSDIKVTKPVDNTVLKDLLIRVYKEHPDQYDKVVSGIKHLGDLFSTYEGISMAIEDISVPKKTERDKILHQGKKDLDAAKTDLQKMNVLESVQKSIIKNDTEDRHDDATLLVKDSGAISGKKIQLTKLRSTPVVISGSEQAYKIDFSQGICFA